MEHVSLQNGKEKIFLSFVNFQIKKIIIPKEFCVLSLKIVFFLTFRLAASSEGKERKDGHYRDLRRFDINYRY